MSQRLTTAVTTFYALVFLIAGAVLVFAPGESAAFLFAAEAGSPIVFSLLGAALFAFGIVDWTARRSLLGGIYGRAVVLGNATHLVVGALALVRFVADGGRHPVLWGATAVYAVGAVFYGLLLFRSPVGPPSG